MEHEGGSLVWEFERILNPGCVDRNGSGLLRVVRGELQPQILQMRTTKLVSSPLPTWCHEAGCPTINPSKNLLP